jgi:2-polyprenyl-3-methyl-5-hydroxy-6-metoxy-1,4-benzoquinol methylase
MNPQVIEQTESAELTELEKIKQQFNHTPYPRIPLEHTPKADYESLFLHSLATPYYLKFREVVETEGKIILDAGCGSGFKSLVLAHANPGAKIVSIDISEASVELTRQRLKHHGFTNVECHTMLIDELPNLGMKFDYINCDEVLYLLPDPLQGLKSFKSVLAPRGILRANLHSAFQRTDFFRAQTLFKTLGLMDEGPTDFEYDVVIETMKALQAAVKLKAETWTPEYEKPEQSASLISVNQLLVGDRGFTIPEMFTLLEQSDLDSFSMVNWRAWDVAELFNDPENLPAMWGMSLACASKAEKLRIFELLHPVHRLLDFWCTHSELEDGVPVDDWSETDWRNATVHLHPQLQKDAIRNAVRECAATGRSLEMSQWVKKTALSTVMLESTVAACLLPLWESPQSMGSLVDLYQKIKPLHLVTLEPIGEAAAFEEVRALLDRMDAFLYVLVEK